MNYNSEDNENYNSKVIVKCSHFSTDSPSDPNWIKLCAEPRDQKLRKTQPTEKKVMKIFNFKVIYHFFLMIDKNAIYMAKDYSWLNQFISLF